MTYRLNLKNPQDIQPIHGTPLEQYRNGALRIHGRTLSMAYHGDFLFLLHQCMGQKRAIALFVKDSAIRFRSVLSEAFRRYSPLLIDPRGNLYLLCEDRTKPMLKFLPGKNVFSRPDRQILLPATYRARFSQDGSLLIILSLDHNEKWTQSLWLWGTKNWQPLDANHHIHAAEVSLSASGSHWLISGRNGCLTETCHTQSNP